MRSRLPQHSRKGISVCLAAITKYHRLGDFHSNQLFLVALEAGESEIRASADLVPGESSLPAP